MKARGLTFLPREGTNDYNVIGSCVTADEYDLDAYLKPGVRLFDIGAHCGAVAVWAATRGCTVVAVEPLVENCLRIKEHAEINGVKDGFVIVEAAVGTESISYGGHDEHHRYVGNMAGGAGRGTRKVRCTTLESLVTRYGAPDIVKIDCEGGEWSVLEEAAAWDVPLIVGEWHATEGHTRRDVTELLWRTHFVEFTGPEGGPGGFRASLCV